METIIVQMIKDNQLREDKLLNENQQREENLRLQIHNLRSQMQKEIQLREDNLLKEALKFQKTIQLHEENLRLQLQKEKQDLEDRFRQEIKEIQKEKQDREDYLQQQIRELEDKLFGNQIQLSRSNSASSSGSISSINSQDIDELLSQTGFKKEIEGDIEMILPNNSPVLSNEASFETFDWTSGETPENTVKANKILERNLNNLGEILSTKKNGFKLVNVSKNKIFAGNFVDSIQKFVGSCDAIIVPKRAPDAPDRAACEIRILIEYKTPKNFNAKSNGHTIGKLLAGCYKSKHPFLLFKTDLSSNYQIWQIINNQIYFWILIQRENAYKALAHWLLNVCSRNPSYDWIFAKENIDEQLIYPMRFLNDKFKVFSSNSTFSLLKEQLEVAEIADSDLTSIEQFISIQQIFTSFFK